MDYLTTLSNQAVISLLYHKKLDDEWRQQAERFRDALRAQNLNVHLIGRATKTKIELDQDYIDERLPVGGGEMIYRQVENSFTQPNAVMNVQMLEWAIDATKGATGDLLELYCGNGNFSLALARNFERVLATEIAKPSVAAAQYNIAANHIDNVQIIRMSAEEFTQAMNGVREFNRLQGIDLKSYQCETIFVDPPRSGLDSETEKMVQAYPRILYISCNPETLCQNLETLSETHAVTRLALFDQFPYTHHMECGVLLTKILRAHNGAVNQHTENKASSGKPRQTHGHTTILIALMQAVYRQHQRQDGEDGKRDNGAEQRGEGTINR